jgi:hypothetical protein
MLLTIITQHLVVRLLLINIASIASPQLTKPVFYFNPKLMFRLPV